MQLGAVAALELLESAVARRHAGCCVPSLPTLRQDVNHASASTPESTTEQGLTPDTPYETTGRSTRLCTDSKLVVPSRLAAYR